METKQSIKSDIISSTVFNYFIRINYKPVELSNEEIHELCVEFNKYLDDLNLSSELIEKILPKNEMEIIINRDNPLKYNGFHPALLLHFGQFIDKLHNNKK